MKISFYILYLSIFLSSFSFASELQTKSGIFKSNDVFMSSVFLKNKGIIADYEGQKVLYVVKPIWTLADKFLGGVFTISKVLFSQS
jgi:hypothetical protein